MPFKKYTTKDRAKIVALLISSGYPFREGSLRYTQDITGIDKGQLRRWFWAGEKYFSTEELEKEIMDLKPLLEKEIEKILSEMDNKRGDASYRELATPLAIFMDKILLLEGAATSRTETISRDWKEIVANERSKAGVKYDPREETK